MLVGKQIPLVVIPGIKGGIGVRRLKSFMAGQATWRHVPGLPAFDGRLRHFSFVCKQSQELTASWLLCLLFLLEQAHSVISERTVAVYAFNAEGGMQIFQFSCRSLSAAGVTEGATVVVFIEIGGVKTMHRCREIQESG